MTGTTFTSRRERRLRTWTAMVVVVIHNAFGSAGVAADVVRSQGLSAAVFATGMLLVAVTIVSHGFTSRPGRHEIVVGVGVAAVCLLALLRMAILEERSHLIEYGVVAVFVRRAFGTCPPAEMGVVPGRARDRGHGGDRRG